MVCSSKLNHRRCHRPMRQQWSHCCVERRWREWREQIRLILSWLALYSTFRVQQYSKHEDSLSSKRNEMPPGPLWLCCSLWLLASADPSEARIINCAISHGCIFLHFMTLWHVNLLLVAFTRLYQLTEPSNEWLSCNDLMMRRRTGRSHADAVELIQTMVAEQAIEMHPQGGGRPPDCDAATTLLEAKITS